MATATIHSFRDPAGSGFGRRNHLIRTACCGVAIGRGPIADRALMRTSLQVRFGRVEDGRGSLGHSATLRFPSPLIKPDEPISGIRLSDWLHRKAHGAQTNRTRLRHGEQLSFATRHSNLRRRLSLMVFAGSSPITTTSPSSKAHQKSGPFAPPALPGINA